MDNAADLVRTSVDYKYILILLFIKRLSDGWKEEVEDAMSKIMEEAGIDESEAGKRAVSNEFHNFMVPENALCNNIRKDREKLKENMSRGINEIAKENKELDEIVNRIDFIDLRLQSIFYYMI